MMGPGLDLLLHAVLALLALGFCCTVAASIMVDWSKSPINHYGLWSVCNSNGPDVCVRRRPSGLPPFQACESLLALAQGLAVVGSLAVVGGVGGAWRLAAKWHTASAATLRQLSYMLVAADAVLLLGAGVYLSVDAEGQCIFEDFGTHLGSSWYLHLCGLVLSAAATALVVVAQAERKGPSPRPKAAPPSGPLDAARRRARLWWRRLQQQLRRWWAKLRSYTTSLRPSSSAPTITSAPAGSARSTVRRTRAISPAR